MSIGTISALIRSAVFQILSLAAPLLVTALIVGLTVSILQATTSIQEQTLTFVPKLLAILLMLALLGGWMFSSIGTFTVELFSMIPDMAR